MCGVVKKQGCLNIKLKEERANTSVGARVSDVVVGLLARWAVRAAQRSREARQAVPLKRVSLDETKS